MLPNHFETSIHILWFFGEKIITALGKERRLQSIIDNMSNISELKIIKSISRYQNKSQQIMILMLLDLLSLLEHLLRNLI